MYFFLVGMYCMNEESILNEREGGSEGGSTLTMWQLTVINSVLEVPVMLSSPVTKIHSGCGWGNHMIFQFVLNQVMNFRGHDF